MVPRDVTAQIKTASKFANYKAVNRLLRGDRNAMAAWLQKDRWC